MTIPICSLLPNSFDFAVYEMGGWVGMVWWGGVAGIVLPVWGVCRDFAVVGGKNFLTETFSAAGFYIIIQGCARASS